MPDPATADLHESTPSCKPHDIPMRRRCFCSHVTGRGLGLCCPWLESIAENKEGKTSGGHSQPTARHIKDPRCHLRDRQKRSRALLAQPVFLLLKSGRKQQEREKGLGRSQRERTLPSAYWWGLPSPPP
ncbi:hypothetical protein CK820_G0047482 [Pan troglodytes]|uniref:Uncharacterized protein n=1 Tax=Pan troglodytes TaxID=9598 RepID=A0A2J8Q0I0_PANTR|nr:hypothetical protein CK820_G0047482 [Pan troglodytes]